MAHKPTVGVTDAKGSLLLNKSTAFTKCTCCGEPNQFSRAKCGITHACRIGKDSHRRRVWIQYSTSDGDDLDQFEFMERKVLNDDDFNSFLVTVCQQLEFKQVGLFSDTMPIANIQQLIDAAHKSQTILAVETRPPSTDTPLLRSTGQPS